MSSSPGACNTIITLPIRHMAHPSFPSVPSSSFKKYVPNTALHPIVSTLSIHLTMNTYPTRTLNAPNGVTKIAGANAYAAKLAISPRATAKIRQHFPSLLRHELWPTCNHACPPYWVLEISETFTLKTRPICSLHQPLLDMSVSIGPECRRRGRNAGKSYPFCQYETRAFNMLN